MGEFVMEEVILTASDHLALYVHCWRAESPRAAVLLAHGMAEHSLRYDALGEFLSAHGISLYCHDQRGHGRTGDAHLGHLRRGLDWNLMIDDLFSVKRKLIAPECEAPIFLMGHSMGSFLVRRAVQLRPAMFDGLILSGTGDGNGLLGKLSVYLADAVCLVRGEERPAKFLQRLIFGGYNKCVYAPRTDSDWLSRDPEQVSRYIADGYCGFLCSNGFFHELLCGVQLANDPRNIASMRKTMPVYLFSGDCDPVGRMGAGVRHVQSLFLQAGMEDVTVRLYPGGRHEMLNETNREQVMADLLGWLDRHLMS